MVSHLFGVCVLYYSGKLFEPDANGKINIIAILVGYIVDYIGKAATAAMVFAIGLIIAVLVARSKT